MDNTTKLKASIIEKADELNQRSFLGLRSYRLTDYNDKKLIESKVKASKRSYWIYLALSVFCGGILYVAGFAQVFEFNFFDLSKAGLLIILTFGNIAQAWNHRVEADRLRMILYLVDLKDKIESK